MKRTLLLVALGMLMCSIVEAGPFGLFGRRGCSSGNCSSSYSSARVAGGCSSGNCAAPQIAGQLEQHSTQPVVAEIPSIDWAISTERLLNRSNPLVRAHKIDNAQTFVTH